MYVLKPRLSEKAYGTSAATNTFVIDVPTNLNKHAIADEVAKQFDVTVAHVRTVNRKGKAKRIMNTTGKRSSNRKGSQSDIKKAYVTLAAGSHLPFFEAAEAEAAKAEESAKKAAKAADKKADKKDAKVDAKKADKKPSKKEEKK